MASRAQQQFLSSLRHTLLDLARRLQQDTVSEDVADYVLFRLEQISRHLVRLADNMQVFDTVRTSLATVTRMLSEVERNWHDSSPAVAYQPRTVGRPRFEIPREQLQYLVDYDNQRKSPFLASVFLTTLFPDPQNSGEARIRLPGMGRY